MFIASKRIFRHVLVWLTVLLTCGCALAPTTTASFVNDFHVSYKGEEYSSFLGFLTDYLSQFNNLTRPQVGSEGTISHPQFYAKETVLLNEELVLHDYTFLSSISDPYHPESMVPFYQRHQSYYPAYTASDLTIAAIFSQEPVVDYNQSTYFRMQDFTFYTGADGFGAYHGEYGGGGFWSNPIVENMVYNVGNSSIIDPVNSTVVQNFQIISQTEGSFEVALDVVSWRLGYFDYNLTAAELIDQTDFSSTITLHFLFEADQDKLTISYDPGTRFVLPFANDYVPTAADEVDVTIEFQIGTVDWTTFDGVKTFSVEELSGLMNEAWIGWGGLGTFLK